MKAKKTLFLTVLTVMLLVGLVATGTALAAPGGLHATHIAGTIERPPVSQTYGTPSVHGNQIVRPGNVITYAWHGALEGTFVEYFTDRAPLSPDALNGKGPYTLAGKCTFVGTLNGKKISWVACIVGKGYIDPAYLFRGWETTVITITSSSGPLCVRGCIIAKGVFDALDPTYGFATYSGCLIW